MFSCLLVIPGLGNSVNLKQLAAIVSTDGHESPESRFGSPYLVGVRQFYTQDYEVAIRTLDMPFPHREDIANYFLVQALVNNGEWHRALTHLNVGVLWQEALIVQLFVKHEADLSVSEQATYVELVRRSPSMALFYANQFLSQNRFDEAANLARSVPNYSHSIAARLIVGRALLYQRKLVEAEAIFQELDVEEPQADTKFWYGRSLYEQGEFAQASNLFEQAMSTAKYVARLSYLPYVVAALAKSGRCNDAVRYLEVADEQAASDQEHKQVMQSYVRINDVCK